MIMKTKKHISYSSLIIFLVFLFSPILTKADEITDTMKNYCVVPPFMEANTKPNILLVMDFSGSMQDPAYTESYNKNKSYYGYFRPNSYYKYNPSGYWEENPSCNIDENNKYYRIGNSTDCVSGNLLNWISTSRIDVSLKAMIGGKAKDCNGNICLVNRGGYRAATLTISNSKKCNLQVFIKNWGSYTCSHNGYRWYYSKNAYENCDMMINIWPKNNKSCPIGTSEDDNKYLKVKVDKREGVLQKNKDLGNFAFIVFGGTYNPDREGEIRVGLNDYENNGIDYLVSKIESEFPFGMTPTGQALYEVIDYLKQSNEHGYERNGNYINKNTEVDPFYDKYLAKTIPCKNNAVILISDGLWNVNNNDPINPAYEMHVNDLRSDLDRLFKST